jgi:hypothetical protein
MPAAPVNNPPWATGTWSDTAWEANTWGAGAPDPGLGSSLSGGYVPWQTSIIVVGSLFGALQGVYERLRRGGR